MVSFMTTARTIFPSNTTHPIGPIATIDEYLARSDWWISAYATQTSASAG